MPRSYAHYSWAQICVAALVSLFATVSISAQSSAPTAPPADLDDYVAGAMKTFAVPGLALAIVKDGKILVAKGYGVRKLGDPTAVDEHTMFAIGSNTKAFTTAALATLVDAGKLSWDDPVYQRLAGICDVRPICLARDDHPRSAHAPQRHGAGRRRSAVLAAIDLHAG